MQRKNRPQQAILTMDTVWESVAELEKAHNVHCHYVFRRDAGIRRKGTGRIIFFCRRLGLGDEGRVVHREEISYPTPDGTALEAILYQLCVWADNRLDEAERIAEAEQGRLFSDQA